MDILVKNGHIIDCFQKINGKYDILVSNGKVCKLEENIQEKSTYTIIDAAGMIITPGLIDMHVHLREPGYEDKETIETGSQAALAGGFTSVVCMPNTNPVIDCKDTIDYIKRKSSKVKCNIFLMGSITKGLKGIELSEHKELIDCGIVGITDDGYTVMNSRLLYEAMQFAGKNNLLVSSHCEDGNLVYDRSINRGKISEELKLHGIPAIAEELIIMRDIALAEITDSKIHIQHISTKKGVNLVKDAKKRGLKVTCEVTPHHFSLTENDVLDAGTNGKMSPPLRLKEDVEYIKYALSVGIIDAIATDHAPHTVIDKEKDLVGASNGITGLETALGITLTELYHSGIMSLEDTIEKLTYSPANILNIDKGTLMIGKDADITIIDINKSWKVDKNQFYSKGINTPFDGFELKGKAVMTIVNGEIAFIDK